MAWILKLTLLALFSYSAYTALAAESVPQASSKPPPNTARVAFTKFPPWSFKNSDGQYVGILVDYIRDLARIAGVALREEDIPIARLHHSFLQGKLDLFFAHHTSLDCCVAIDKAYDGETIVIGRKKGPLFDLSNQGHSICRTGLSGYEVPGFRMFDADSLETCIRMVARDRLPFLVGERMSLLKVLQSHPRETHGLFAEPVVVEKRAIYLYLSKAIDSTPSGQALRKAAQERKIGEYMNRYMEEPH